MKFILIALFMKHRIENCFCLIVTPLESELLSEWAEESASSIGTLQYGDTCTGKSVWSSEDVFSPQDIQILIWL